MFLAVFGGGALRLGYFRAAEIVNALKEVRQADFKDAGQLAERSDPQVFLSALDGAGKRPPEAAFMGQALLRPVSFAPQIADPLPKVFSHYDRILHLCTG